MNRPLPDPLSSRSLTIATRNFGTITIRADQIISIIPGLVGFSNCRRFVLIEGHYAPPFLGLQCLDNPDLSFVVIDPVHLVPDYRLHLPPIQKALGPCNPEDLQILVFLTIPRDKPEDMTANLASPLIINLNTGRARRIYIDRPEYALEHRVFAGSTRERNKS